MPTWKKIAIASIKYYDKQSAFVGNGVYRHLSERPALEKKPKEATSSRQLVHNLAYSILNLRDLSITPHWASKQEACSLMLLLLPRNCNHRRVNLCTCLRLSCCQPDTNRREKDFKEPEFDLEVTMRDTHLNIFRTCCRASHDEKDCSFFCVIK